MQRNRLVTLLALGTATALAACADGVAPRSRSILGTLKPVSLSFATRGGTIAAMGSLASGNVLITQDSDTIVITKAQMVFGRMELVRADTAACQADDDGERGDSSLAFSEGRDSTDSTRNNENENENECQELKAGPVLVDLPVDSSVVTSLNVPIPAGTYSFFKAKIRVPRANDSTTAAFVAANPGFDSVSVRVEGTFNGTPFVYKGSPEAKLFVHFNPPLDVSGSTTNITVNVNLDKWFRDSTGKVIDPATANKGGVNAERVSRNIKRSFNAMEDRNRDCRDDDGNDNNGNDDNGGGSA